MELTSVLAFAAVVCLAISGNEDAILMGIDIPYREKATPCEEKDGVVRSVEVDQANPNKLRELSEYLPAKVVDCKGHGNCLYFQIFSLKTNSPFIWKLIFKQGAGVDWFNKEEEKKFPATNFLRKETIEKKNGDKVEVELTMSRVCAILRFVGLKGDFENNSLYVIDCRNYINQVEGKVLMGERVTEACTSHGEEWLSYYLHSPSPFYQTKEWVTLGSKAIMECDKDISIAEFFCSNDASVENVVRELWAGIGFYIRSEWLGRWALYCNVQGIKDNKGDDVLWSPLCPMALLKTSEEATRILLEMLPVFVNLELRHFGKYCNQKVYNAKAVMEYNIYHILFYGQEGCVQLEKTKKTGELGKYGHSRIWVHQDYLKGKQSEYFKYLKTQGWVQKKDKKKQKKEVLGVGNGNFRIGGKIGLGVLAFHIHADAVEFSRIRKFSGVSQSLQPPEFVCDGEIGKGYHPNYNPKHIPLADLKPGFKRFDGLTVQVPEDLKKIFKTRFENLGKFLDNSWEEYRWWVENVAHQEEGDVEKQRRIKRRRVKDNVFWTLTLETYVFHSRKEFV